MGKILIECVENQLIRFIQGLTIATWPGYFAVTYNRITYVFIFKGTQGTCYKFEIVVE